MPEQTSRIERRELSKKFMAQLKASMIEQHKKDYKTFVEIYGEDEAKECLYTKDGLYNPQCKTKIIIR